MCEVLEEARCRAEEYLKLLDLLRDVLQARDMVADVYTKGCRVLAKTSNTKLRDSLDRIDNYIVQVSMLLTVEPPINLDTLAKPSYMYENDGGVEFA